MKGLHDGLLFFSGHAAMNEAARAVLKEFMAQLFVKVGRGLKVDGLRGLYQGTDDVALLAGFHELVHEGIDPPAQGFPDSVGFNRFSSRRQFADRRHVEIAVQRQGKRSGNGRRRHE